MSVNVAPKRLNMTLADRIEAEEGWLYMTGMQALVRLPIQQRKRDAAAGLITGGFISGYRGSPLGRYDIELWQAQEALRAHNIVFRPGVNEDLAATAAWGAQMVGLYPGATVDGVFSIWYGKAPGMDRSMDPLRHANLSGASPRGGALLLVGDDHGAKSSTVACYSDYNFVSIGAPLLAPSNAQEVLDLGLHGIAMSRWSGCLVGMKLVTDVIEGGGSVLVGPDSPPIVMPEGKADVGPQVFRPFLQQEAMLYERRIGRALDYARLNGLNRIEGPAEARIGIVSSGKSWQDLRQALRALGMRDGMLGRMPVRLLKLGMTWPLDDEIVRDFARGLEAIVVVEEKRPLIEDQIRSILYGAPNPPRLIGKFFDGRLYGAGAAEPAFPAVGELDPGRVAQVVARTALSLDPDCGVGGANAPLPEAARAGGPTRAPSFCAGCPHGRSTKVIEGSRALAGIGCHSMAMMRDPMRTNGMSHMGGEGAMWIGQQPFTQERHVFANMGDGTYFHSGILAIRAAVAAGVPITFKLLHNGFVSMTGGQPVDGELSPARMIEQLRAEGVRRIALVADEPERHKDLPLPEGVTLHPRAQLEAVQKELREIPEVTALIYDQPCATERRRLRKRGKWPDPDRRVFINAEVCEGCGDCSTVSDCMAIEPLETELGRKRRINQSSCNKDFSCVEGFCPSFVTVSGARPRKARVEAAQIDDSALPAPRPAPVDGATAVLIAGIGGTGVVTMGQTLAIAAHADGLFSSNLDVTGLAQKYGAVHSHVKIARDPAQLTATRIAAGEADLLIGCDLVVAAGAESLAALRPDGGRVVADRTLTPTADFARNPDWALNADELTARLRAAAAEGRALILDAERIAAALLGDAIYANMMLLGAAWQLGALPLSHEAIMRAIELNGVQVELNRRAFALGRLAAHDPERVERMAREAAPAPPVDLAARRETPLEALIEDRAARLRAYGGRRLARRYRARLAPLLAAEAALGRGDGASRAAAQGLFKLMAPKDPWEVARLYARPEFRRELERAFEGDLKLTFHIGAWPFGRLDPATGKHVKGEVGGWAMGAFKVMSALRFLRGTWLDPFRRGEEAELARRLEAAYLEDLELAAARLSPDTLDAVRELLALPETIRGYGHVRAAAAQRAEARRTRLRARLETPAEARAA
ncbi:indolepyruvate ferredoxin oxidoreductase family protein [Oceanicella actignis]|uniref:Indolepyruvate ferredoxin oxidoreductase n=1 Tax=Oceanicella actignis TaxID=1189325 RepID=A0A1M7S9Y7_9RHOB|nr:indolepyruvate ferredoxin oxidoreductase family protein [Oceanicella actignis]SET30267.1 indolepyruvate ferredoxin oxidoreductase [Oceanicella actignis]SHN55270.1 indolepyruvate ferredoxin oxidoreductase [Oceanicella actignis]